MEKDLMRYYWPPVGKFKGFEKDLELFLHMPYVDKLSYLEVVRRDEKRHGEFIQNSLGMIYGYSLGYVDSPVYNTSDDRIEIQLEEAKIALEREMLDHWLEPTEPPRGLSQGEACEYLEKYIESNTGIYHDFFEYVATDMSKENLLKFLFFETIRNEVVDDEVALIIVGLQGVMKNTMVSNLWDECGNGNIEGFHTYWLRQLLEHTNMFDKFIEYRDTFVPWFSKITSNSFNMMATRSGYKYRAYGSFLITESWVSAHFKKILEGLRRVGLTDENIQIYFTKHCTIDPYHTEEMLSALRNQEPILNEEEVFEVLKGAHTAVSAGTKLYKHSLEYFLSKQ